jgi:hypothetical protein
MQFETIDDASARDGSAGPDTATNARYETRGRQERADVTGVYAPCERSSRRGVMGEANLAYLREACDRAGVALGAFDTRILAWLAGWEPETCAVAGLVTRAYAAGLGAADTRIGRGAVGGDLGRDRARAQRQDEEPPGCGQVTARG